ncbi:hypothetical protein [Facklamia miroungae]|uniref:Uncharacterized protein n=1 Tax=Facklamia miroungae TaxID=120956 RepID=A0A1G7TIP9_9LACT|nr:hypothetical protein [Facklamia miroungae]NKZ29819.1 hypothetical protein [Facklamia miroungae]SDG35213.1 hypothetical protein SAMN05421791_10635 [Facklamia miroungae]
MSLATIFNEFYRFIINNLRRIIFGSVIISLLVVGGRYVVNRIINSDTIESYNYLAHAYQQEPASFQVIVTMEDGSLFSTAAVFDDYFATPAIVEQIEKQTGVKFGKWLQAEHDLEMYKTNTFRGGLAGIRDAASNVITLRFLVGQNAEENLKIAQAYANLLKNNKLPFLDKNTVTIIRSPEIGEMIPIDLVEDVPSKETLTPFQTKEAKGSIIYGILGLFIGAMLSIVWSMILHYRKHKIGYAFDYTWSINDLHFIFDRQDSKVTLDKLIQTPSKNDRVILRQQKHQEPHVQELISADGSKYGLQTASLANLDSDHLPNEIVIILDANLTDKDWYNEQRQLAELYQARIKIIQLI